MKHIKTIKYRSAALLLALLLALALPALAFAEDSKMYILGNPSDTQEPILTVGAQPETAQTGSDPDDASAGLSEEELERRKEIYSMVALITVGAIIVGIRNKRGGR